MRFLASSADRRPSTVSSPASGNRIDMISRMVVVLPAPFGPMTPYSAPVGTVRSRSCTAVDAPNVLRMPCSRSAAPGPSAIDLSHHPPRRLERALHPAGPWRGVFAGEVNAAFGGRERVDE